MKDNSSPNLHLKEPIISIYHSVVPFFSHLLYFMLECDAFKSQSSKLTYLSSGGIKGSKKEGKSLESTIQLYI